MTKCKYTYIQIQKSEKYIKLLCTRYKSGQISFKNNTKYIKKDNL